MAVEKTDGLDLETVLEKVVLRGVLSEEEELTSKWKHGLNVVFIEGRLMKRGLTWRLVSVWGFIDIQMWKKGEWKKKRSEKQAGH